MEKSLAPGKIGRKITTKDMIMCALFTALIAVGAFIKVPVPVVPFTLQFPVYFGVFLFQCLTWVRHIVGRIAESVVN